MSHRGEFGRNISMLDNAFCVSLAITAWFPSATSRPFRVFPTSSAVASLFISSSSSSRSPQTLCQILGAHPSHRKTVGAPWYPHTTRCVVPHAVIPFCYSLPFSGRCSMSWVSPLTLSTYTLDERIDSRIYCRAFRALDHPRRAAPYQPTEALCHRLA
jgi:hypothetical protein